ncbi:Mu transposase domain-containing protein [Mammaliicoccus sciuri]|uniref:Mu transposase domain-containing protein n=1 Tax=Mammaliicoccus sciuri TaxID=1296 RepID=UPI001C4E81F6|nr:hypothetical protein [Mammaliicoccus sciuri]
MRNVIQKFVGKHDKELNTELLKLSLFYGFEPVVTNTYSGNEKGHVEKSVQVIRDRAFTKIYEFLSIEHAQTYLTSALFKMNQEKEIANEKNYLKPLVLGYNYAITTSQRVDKYSFIHYQNNFYSVPDYLVGETVTVKLYLKELKVVRKGQIVASHVRLDTRNNYQVQMVHYLYTLKRKTGAIEHSLVLTKLPRLRRCFLQFYKEQPKRFIQLVENKKNSLIDELVIYLDGKAIKDREVLEHNVSNKVINEARNQLEAYNEIHI